MTTTEPTIDPADLATEALDPDGPAPVIATTAIEPRADQQDAVPAGVARLVPGLSIPIVPAEKELATLAQMAVTLAGANACPSALRGKPNDVFMVLLTARDLGVSLTTAMREFHVIDSKVTLSPKVKNAMVKQGGHGRTFPHQGPRPHPDDPERLLLCPCGSDEGPNDTDRAIWHAIRADEPEILHTSRFTREDAQRPQGKNALLGKDNWQNYPQRMLSWRALGYLLDDVFPDVGTGLYSPDELGAVTDEEGQPVIDVMAHATPVAGTKAPAGHRTKEQQAQDDPPASETDVAALRERIAAIGALPAARDALVGLWTKPRAEGSNEPTLPPIQHLRQRQVKVADAMVASIEKRAQGGEWGTWPPSTAQEPAGDAEPPAGDQDATEAGDEPQAAPEPPQEPQHDDVTAVVIAEVKAMDPDKVRDEAETRGLDTGGRLDTVRHRLASAMIAERQQAS